MIPYVGWGCPTCEVGNPATRKRCKKCGRKRPDKYTLTTFHRPPRINKPHKKRSTAMPVVLKKIYEKPKPATPVSKLSARFSDGQMAVLQMDGSITCSCQDFAATKNCRHYAAITMFIDSTPSTQKEP